MKDRIPLEGELVWLKNVSAKKKARELAKYLRAEPGLCLLKEFVSAIKKRAWNWDSKIIKEEATLHADRRRIKGYYEVIWKDKTHWHLHKLADIDFLYCQIRINKGKGSKDRIVPFSDFQTTAHARRSDEKEEKSIFDWVLMEEKVHGQVNRQDIGQIFIGIQIISKPVTT